MLTFTRAYFDRKPVGASLKGYRPAGAVFTVLPLTDLVKQQFVKRHGMCRTCLGLGFFAWNEAPAGKCPTCGGKEGPSYADGEIRRVVFRDIVTGWSGFKFEDGEEIPFTDEYRDAVADNTAFFFQVFNLASEAGVKTTQDEEGNLRAAAAEMFGGGGVPSDLSSWALGCLLAWQRVQTQVRVAPMGGVIGLDYTAARSVLELEDMWTPEILDGLRVIEAEFIKAMRPEDTSGRVGKGAML